MRNKENLKIWIIPLLAVLFTLLWGMFTRLTVGVEDKQDFDFGTIPFVPGESPHSSGQDSR
jgi:hypothetical protein